MKLPQKVKGMSIIIQPADYSGFVVYPEAREGFRQSPMAAFSTADEVAKYLVELLSAIQMETHFEA